MIVGGCDVGSATAKAVLMKDGALLSHAIVPSGTKPELAARKAMDDALETAGVDTTFITVTGGGHGRFQSSELLRRVRLFFDKHLRGQDAEISDTPIKVGQDVKAK